MSTVNLYDVLDVPQDCEIKQIKDAYRTLVKKFHPDKPNGDAEMFELVTHAYNILVNPKTRCEYDEVYALSKQVESTHFSLKDKAAEYFEALEKESSKKTKEESKIDFNKAFEEMDRKHGVSRNDSEQGLTVKETKRRVRDIELAREQDDIENIHEQLFQDGQFDLAKFNAAFDQLHKGHTELIQHDGNPDAWNILDDYGSNFSGIDNYDELYTDDVGLGTNQYGSIKSDPSKNKNKNKNKKLTKEDVDKLSAADYTKGHNHREKNYEKSLEERMREYKLETQKLDDRELDDYNTDPTCGGYGIFTGLGIDNLSTIQWDDDEDIKTRYNRLLEMRKNNDDSSQ
jgi:curved DNA-binding protein CbpA